MTARRGRFRPTWSALPFSRKWPADPRAGNAKVAEEEFRQALTLDPATAVAHYHLGFVFRKQERHTEGLRESKPYLDAPKADPTTLEDARRWMANPVRTPFAPDFSFSTGEGQRSLNDSLRRKVVWLDFRGTGSPPCRESVPLLRDLGKKYSGKACQLVGIRSGDTPSSIRAG